MEFLRRNTLFSKIFVVLFAISFAVMALSTLAATFASFSSYENEAESTLLAQTESCAKLLKGKSAAEIEESLQGYPLADLRVTLIQKDGTVLYDNWANASTMENHSQREEFIEAQESGTASLMRRSETIGSDTLYAAVSLDDGMVLRLAETRTSMGSFLSGMTLQLGICLGIIICLSFALSRLLTRRITRPLKEVDLTNPLDNDVYEEMRPMLYRVDEQRRELKRQNAELERAVEARREFTGNVSHEMKTPLQVIGGYAELMEYGATKPEDNARFAALIRKEAAHMRGLIDDVLTLSRLDEQGDQSHDPIDLSGVCRNVISRLESTASERRISFSVNIEEGLVIYGAESLAQQLVYNLIDNAVRYNRDGGVVSVDLRKAKDEAVFTVSDQGKGIPEEYRERIFERFYRVDASHSRETGGTGLGLAIVKHSVASLGGTVTVGDAPGGGAKFTVTFPC